MPSFAPAQLSHKDRYHLLINAIVPRPIAWITTRDAAGTVNLAPFSFFNGVCAQPPIVSVSIIDRVPPKDTLVNLRANGEAVVHLVPMGELERMHASGGEYAHAVSEAEVLGLALLPSVRVAPPRLAIADVAFECRLHRIVEVGQPVASLCLLEVVHAHVAEWIATEDGLPDPLRMRAVARLGARNYLTGDGWKIRAMPAQDVPPKLR
ncbi:MAG: flavin reductase family protein [Planctomycetes bacterium]|nr:flavin reductase family protein [Planctomycetota bacterium]